MSMAHIDASESERVFIAEPVVIPDLEVPTMRERVAATGANVIFTRGDGLGAQSKMKRAIEIQEGCFYPRLTIDDGPALIDALTLAIQQLRLNGDEDEALHNCLAAVENAYNTEVDKD